MDPLLTTDDVAEFFRMDVVTIRRMIGKGELPAFKVGGEYRFKSTDIDEYLERQRVPTRKHNQGQIGRLTKQVRKLVTPASATNACDLYTDRARKVIALAHEEARQFNRGYLGTEHLLLGILHEGKGVGGQVLEQAGCRLEDLRQAVRDTVGPGPKGETVPDQPALTPRLKKVLELAVDEAKRLEHAYVGTEHLLLGLLREGEGVGGRLLKERGMELSSARRSVLEVLTTKGTSPHRMV